MIHQTRNCQACRTDFRIEPEDLEFYARIQVPPPTFCWKCRMQRRLRYRNEKSLYKDTCDLCGKNMLSMYAPEKKFKVFCVECWWSDNWDPMMYGQDYDTSRPFFDQFRQLMSEVPRPNFMNRNAINCDYANGIGRSKNVYLSNSVINDSEDVYYSKNVDHSKWIMDSFDVENSENCYGLINSSQNFNCKFLFQSQSCIDSWFLFDCVNCQNCAFSQGLRNKQYCIANIQYSKEEYAAKIAGFKFGIHSALEGYEKEFWEKVGQSIHKYGDITKSVNSTGDNLMNVKNAQWAFDTYDSENVKYTFRVPGARDSQDICFAGPNLELAYEYMNLGSPNSSMVKFTINGQGNLRNVEYTDHCQASSDLFGCIGLRKKEYCILNKQYDPGEYAGMVKKIREHMNAMPWLDAGGRVHAYGEFFPQEMSPFAYNETNAQEYYNLTKEQAAAAGYTWRDPDAKSHETTMDSGGLPDAITDVTDAVLDGIIACGHGGKCNEQCSFAYRIVKEELEFYRRMGLPLPRLCPNCRHYGRLAHRNPLDLWERDCMCAGTFALSGRPNTAGHFHGVEQCPNRFQTSFPPSRAETVYCEQCYNAEVA